MKSRILIVEDDENLRLALEDNLVDEGYLVDVAADGRRARAALAKNTYHLVILDIMLPDTDGYTICREIREQKLPVSVLMLTARTLESDLVQGFDAGADDYIAKPYRLREMVARVRALVRRSAPADEASEGNEHRFGGYRLDSQARTVLNPDGNPVSLTRTEFDLLLCLLRHRGKALSRDDILRQAWDPDIVVDPRTVDNFVSNVKRKLGWTRESGFSIKTVRGVGYRLEAT